MLQPATGALFVLGFSVWRIHQIGCPNTGLGRSGQRFKSSTTGGGRLYISAVTGPKPQRVLSQIVLETQKTAFSISGIGPRIAPRGQRDPLVLGDGQDSALKDCFATKHA